MSVTVEIFLIWTNVTRTNVAWTNVNMTVADMEKGADLVNRNFREFLKFLDCERVFTPCHRSDQCWRPGHSFNQYWHPCHTFIFVLSKLRRPGHSNREYQECMLCSGQKTDFFFSYFQLFSVISDNISAICYLVTEIE